MPQESQATAREDACEKTAEFNASEHGGMPLRRVSDYFTAGDLQFCPSAHADIGAFNQMVYTRQKDFMSSAGSIANDVQKYTNNNYDQ